MNGVELTSPELAYLLATLDCNAVVGLEDPSLFPSNASMRGKTFKKGRNELEEHGWITAIPDRTEEYELDALLLETVSIIASPDFMVASTYTTNDSPTQLVFHYLAADRSVELVALDKKRYWLSMLSGRGQIFERIAELMHVEASGASTEAEIEEKTLENVKRYVLNGRQSDAMDALKTSNLDDVQIQSLLSAIESNSCGSIVLVNIENGEISSGRRFFVYGSGESAWMTYKVGAQSSVLGVRPYTEKAIGDYFDSFLESELSKHGGSIQL